MSRVGWGRNTRHDDPFISSCSMSVDASSHIDAKNPDAINDRVKGSVTPIPDTDINQKKKTTQGPKD